MVSLYYACLQYNRYNLIWKQCMYIVSVTGNLVIICEQAGELEMHYRHWTLATVFRMKRPLRGQLTRHVNTTEWERRKWHTCTKWRTFLHFITNYSWVDMYSSFSTMAHHVYVQLLHINLLTVTVFNILCNWPMFVPSWHSPYIQSHHENFDPFCIHPLGTGVVI